MSSSGRIRWVGRDASEPRNARFTRWRYPFRPASRAGERDLLLYCHVLSYLRRDHAQIEQLLHALRASLERREPPDALLRHLDGIGAIMESHFRYEERQLLGVLEDLRLEVDPGLGPPTAFGPL
ncbi:MAG TPA: hemerythrin domain-containing protein [Nocardioides sp.]